MNINRNLNNLWNLKINQKINTNILHSYYYTYILKNVSSLSRIKLIFVILLATQIYWDKLKFDWSKMLNKTIFNGLLFLIIPLILLSSTYSILDILMITIHYLFTGIYVYTYIFVCVFVFVHCVCVFLTSILSHVYLMGFFRCPRLIYRLGICMIYMKFIIKNSVNRKKKN